MDGVTKPNALTRHLTAKVASLPMILTALVVFVGGPIWTVVYSFTSSRALQELTFVGFDQYTRLFSTPRWNASVENILLYAGFSLLFTFVIGFVLAACLDQKVRFENTFRSIYLYPFALSFIVTGIAWQWILNPTLGLQKSIRDLGWETFTFDLIANRETVMYAVLIAGVWQGTGLVMALMLAGMRGIDDDIWKAARVDGIPKWRTYVQIVIPMMRPVFITCFVIAAAGIVKLYDLVVAMTAGGPGISSEVPAKYVYDFMFARANLGQALAASTMMLVTVLIILIPWMYLEYGSKKQRG
jgi:glucose/mannose transport system permease protein